MSELVFTGQSPKKKKATRNNAPLKLESKSLGRIKNASFEHKQTLGLETQNSQEKLPILAQIKETVVQQVESQSPPNIQSRKKLRKIKKTKSIKNIHTNPDSSRMLEVKGSYESSSLQNNLSKLGLNKKLSHRKLLK